MCASEGSAHKMIFKCDIIEMALALALYFPKEIYVTLLSGPVINSGIVKNNNALYSGNNMTKTKNIKCQKREFMRKKEESSLDHLKGSFQSKWKYQREEKKARRRGELSAG